MPNASRLFLQEFLKSPRTVASIVPSSAFLERRVVRAAEPKHARVVVELGAGTGGITRALLESMSPESCLLAIERTAEFAERLREIDDPRFEVVHDCASSILHRLRERGFSAADAVVSGIPFSTMPEAVCAEIITGVVEALRNGGRFVAYQFTDRVADYARPILGKPRVEHELMNVPPLRVFTWHTTAATRSTAAN